MSSERPPARPWYDLVVEQAAIRGWSISELARKAKVGRPTIYGWRDSTEGRLQAGPVNAVADALGISRERALRLAGIIGSEPADPPQRPRIPRRLLQEIESTEGLDEEGRQAVIAMVEEQMLRERSSWEESAPPPPSAPAGPARRRPAS